MLHIHPEADPGHDHDEDGGHVALDQVEANAAVKPELGRQAAVVTCNVMEWKTTCLIIKLIKTNTSMVRWVAW